MSKRDLARAYNKSVKLARDIEQYYTNLARAYKGWQTRSLNNNKPQKAQEFKKLKEVVEKQLRARHENTIEDYRRRVEALQGLPYSQQRDKLLSAISSFTRSLTATLAFVKDNFNKRKSWIKRLTSFKSQSQTLRERIKKIPVERWISFDYAWAASTRDPTFGNRSLELHFKSQAPRSAEKKIRRIGAHIFDRLMQKKDLKFLQALGHDVIRGKGYVDGFRSKLIVKPENITYNVKVMDMNYGFNRVDKSGRFPAKWWELSPKQVFDIINAGLFIELIRGKGRPRRDSAPASDFAKAGVRGQSLLNNFRG